VRGKVFILDTSSSIGSISWNWFWGLAVLSEQPTSALFRFVSEKFPSERKMTCHFMGVTNVVELGFGGRVDAYFRPAPRLVHRATWGKPAAAVRTLEIKYPPVAHLTL
jgi:hypothetical protein